MLISKMKKHEQWTLITNCVFIWVCKKRRGHACVQLTPPPQCKLDVVRFRLDGLTLTDRGLVERFELGGGAKFTLGYNILISNLWLKGFGVSQHGAPCCLEPAWDLGRHKPSSGVQGRSPMKLSFFYDLKPLLNKFEGMSLWKKWIKLSKENYLMIPYTVLLSCCLKFCSVFAFLFILYQVLCILLHRESKSSLGCKPTVLEINE